MFKHIKNNDEFFLEELLEEKTVNFNNRKAVYRHYRVNDPYFDTVRIWQFDDGEMVIFFENINRIYALRYKNGCLYYDSVRLIEVGCNV